MIPNSQLPWVERMLRRMGFRRAFVSQHGYPPREPDYPAPLRRP